MSNFLIRRHVAHHFKYMNKKFWPNVLKLSQNVTFNECMFQERFASTGGNYGNSGCTRGTLLDLKSWKRLACRDHCEGSFVQRSRHIDLQRVYLSTSSSFDNGSSCVVERCFPVNISDSSLSTDESVITTEMAAFAEKLQECASPEDVLTLAESTMYTKPCRVEFLPLVYSAYQEHVYQTLSFPWILPERSLRRMQLEDNFLVDEVIGPHTRDSRFQNLMSLTEENIGDISYNDCVQILQSLHYLFLTKVNSILVDKLCDVCNKNLDKLDLHQLASLLTSTDPYHSDNILAGKIANATKIWLLTHSPDDVNLADLCQVFNKVRYILSTEMFKLGSDIIIRKLKTHPSEITLETIGKIGLFCHISYNKCEHDLINGIQDIPAECFDVDISEKDLTIEVCSDIEKNLYVCPVKDKLKRVCISEIQKATALSVNNVMRYSVLLSKLCKPVMCSHIDLFLEHVKRSDNFLLLQLMRGHSELDFQYIPCSRELLDAYHHRFVRFFTSYSLSDQSLLLWQNGGQFGKSLFALMCKLKSSGMNLNPCIISAFNNHFVLSANEWDASYMKIIQSALFSIEKLKSNVLLSPSNLETLEKLFARVDFTYLMYVMKNLDLISSQPSLSQAVRKQSLELKSHFQEVFESKLSSANRLTPHLLSNKIVPYFRRSSVKRSSFRKPPGSDAYGHLIESMPRFLVDGDRENCLHALQIMYYGVLAYPVYQKETFETLIRVVTTSPKVLIQPGLQLVKVLAYSGYLADINGGFTSWTQDLVTEVLKLPTFSSFTLVSLGYHLSLLGIFHDALTLKIFSLDFLSQLEQELHENPDHLAAGVKDNLALLNRSVAIECPHLAVSWFGSNLYTSKDRWQPSQALEELVNSIHRLAGDESYLVQSAKSPYGHHIDVLLFFDPSSGLLKCDVDAQNMQNIPGVEKIALLCPQWLQYCYSSDVLVGPYQADIRQLQILGYTVVVFTEKELSSMDVYSNEHLDNHVKSKINACLHLPVFKDHQ